MENETKEKLKKTLSNLENKDFKIYFLVQDTKGNARASVKYIYDLALTLKNSGFSPVMLYEKPDFTSVSSWLDEKYSSELNHQYIEGQNLQVTPEDFIVVPEIYGYVMEQLTNLPCGKIVLSQCHSYLVETLQPGQNWSQLGFLKCITTTEEQKNYVETIMRQTTFDVLTPFIEDFFQPKSLPSLPIVAVHSREQSDTINLIKTFYLKYPQFRWFTFKDMRGLSTTEFAENLKDCFLSVWIDQESSFGTFPLESMACNVPVMGLLPYLQPSWITESNGIWVQNKNSLPDFISDFIQNWLEDNIKPELYDEGLKTSSKFKNKIEFESKSVELFNNYIKSRIELFSSQL